MPKSRHLALYGAQDRWTESQAREALAALDASGLSAFAFARREGLDTQRLYRWRRNRPSDYVNCPAGPHVRDTRRARCHPLFGRRRAQTCHEAKRATATPLTQDQQQAPPQQRVPRQRRLPSRTPSWHLASYANATQITRPPCSGFCVCLDLPLGGAVHAGGVS
jgi:hypothetical protein